jgi:hypothetical protein
MNKLAEVFVQEVEKEATQCAVDMLLTSAIAFPDKNERVTTVSAATTRAISQFLLAQCAALMDHHNRPEAERKKRPSREFQLFALLFTFNSIGGSLSVTDILTLSHKQLALLGHELPETERCIGVKKD